MSYLSVEGGYLRSGLITDGLLLRADHARKDLRLELTLFGGRTDADETFVNPDGNQAFIAGQHRRVDRMFAATVGAAWKPSIEKHGVRFGATLGLGVGGGQLIREVMWSGDYRPNLRLAGENDVTSEYAVAYGRAGVSVGAGRWSLSIAGVLHGGFRVTQRTTVTLGDKAPVPLSREEEAVSNAVPDEAHLTHGFEATLGYRF